MPNFYHLLGCAENASYEEIKRSYQSKLTEAWNTLRDAGKRKAYDAKLLSENCKAQHLINETISWNELDTNGMSFTYPCRCGSVYVIPVEEKNSSTADFLVECTECSFSILIKSQ